MEDKLVKIRELIRIERLKKNLSQENMAMEMGLSQSAYANIENGKTKLLVKELLQIMNILKISSDKISIFF